jgi:hypothetical protein
VMQRPRLLELAQKLDISLVHLRRDQCSDWMLEARFGRIYALPVSYQIIIMGWSTKGWNICKVELNFARLTMDGEDEGSLELDHEPTPDEVDVIRHRVGLKRRRHPDEETLAALRERLVGARAKQRDLLVDA